MYLSFLYKPMLNRFPIFLRNNQSRDITILRKEVFERVKEENKEAISGNLDILKEFN